MELNKAKIYLAALKSVETAEDSAWTWEEDDFDADIFRDCSIEDFCIDDDIYLQKQNKNLTIVFIKQRPNESKIKIAYANQKYPIIIVRYFLTFVFK